MSVHSKIILDPPPPSKNKYVCVSLHNCIVGGWAWNVWVLLYLSVYSAIHMSVCVSLQNCIVGGWGWNVCVLLYLSVYSAIHMSVCVSLQNCIVGGWGQNVWVLLYLSVYSAIHECVCEFTKLYCGWLGTECLSVVVCTYSTCLGLFPLFFLPSERHDFVVFVDNAQHHNVISSYFFCYGV